MLFFVECCYWPAIYEPEYLYNWNKDKVLKICSPSVDG